MVRGIDTLNRHSSRIAVSTFESRLLMAPWGLPRVWWSGGPREWKTPLLSMSLRWDVECRLFLDLFPWPRHALVASFNFFNRTVIGWEEGGIGPIWNRQMFSTNSDWNFTKILSTVDKEEERRWKKDPESWIQKVYSVAVNSRSTESMGSSSPAIVVRMWKTLVIGRNDRVRTTSPLSLTRLPRIEA